MPPPELALPKPEDPLVAIVDSLEEDLHEKQDVFAAGCKLAARFGKPRPQTKSEATSLLLELFYALLNSDRYALAARVLWDRNLFDGRPQCTKDIWEALPKESMLLLQGGSSMSKSYTPCVWLLLDWLRDPEWTKVVCIGPKEQHLIDNVFSNLSRLHSMSTLPLPGSVGDKFIGMSRTDTFGAISGLVVPRGGKGVVIQGIKAQKRDRPHPKFGAQGRLRFFLDEFEDMPPLIFQDIGNVVSGIDYSNPDHLKVICAYNPKHVTGKVAELAEPIKGWDAFDLEEDIKWKSKRGWTVLRLDPFRSENVITGTKLYGGLQTRDALDALRRQAGGEDTAAFKTFGRGAFPSTGATTSAVPQSWLNRSVGAVQWYRTPDTYMGLDLARTIDSTVGCEVQFGEITERRWQGWEEDPMRIMGLPRPRPCILVKRLHQLPPGDTVENAKVIRALATTLGIRPDRINADPGGPSGGSVDIMRDQWSADVMSTWFGGGVSTRKIMDEDRHPPADAGLKQAASEMWLAMRRYFEAGYIVIDEKMPAEERSRLFVELSSRVFKDSTLCALEAKSEFKRRSGGRSPDNADALGLAVHIVRLRGGLRPAASESITEPSKAAPPLPKGFPTAQQAARLIIMGDPKRFMDAYASGEFHSGMQGDCDITNRLEFM